MPNRYIRESAIESEAVNSLSWQAEVFYRRLLNKADDFGRYTANHALLRASLFPLQLDKVREADIPRLIAECEKAGLLFAYVADSKQCLVINKWEKGRANTSHHPPPPANICERMQTFVYSRKHLQTDVPDSDSDPDTDTDSDQSSSETSEFDLFWQAYPRKVGKTAAKKAFLAISRRNPATFPPLLVSKATQYAEAVKRWPPGEERFIPHPATWLNQGRYDDDPKTWERKSDANATTGSTVRTFENAATDAERNAF